MTAVLSFRPVHATDFESLLALRNEALHESLERLGRLDPERSRARFQESFAPELMRHILISERAIGFLTVRPDNEALLLEHLFIRPSEQGQGIGARVLQVVFAEARAAQADVRLAALRDSAANRFYVRHGFTRSHESEWDIHYVWRHSELAG